MSRLIAAMDYQVHDRNHQFVVVIVSVRNEPDFHAFVTMFGKELVGDCLERYQLYSASHYQNFDLRNKGQHKWD